MALTDDEKAAILKRYRPYCKHNGRQALSREFGVPTSEILQLTRGLHRRYIVEEGDAVAGARDLLDWGPVPIANMTSDHRAAINDGRAIIHADGWVRLTGV